MFYKNDDLFFGNEFKTECETSIYDTCTVLNIILSK